MLENQNAILNYTSANRAVMTIPSLSMTTYTLTDFEIPSINLEPALFANPFVDKPFPGEKLKWSPLEVEFLVTENLENYYELFRWITDVGAPEDKQVFIDKKDWMMEVYITVYNSHNNPTCRFRFLDCCPTDLGTISFTEEIQETSERKCSFVMEYERFDMEIVK
jgi:hypothetical protein